MASNVDAMVLGAAASKFRECVANGAHPQAAAESLISKLTRSPDVEKIMIDELRNKAIMEVKLRVKLPYVVLKEKLNDLEKKKLQHLFHQYNIDFSQGLDATGHYFARADRKMSEIRLHDELGYSTTQLPADGYEVVLKDVGANPWKHVTAGRANVHCCAPNLSHTDCVRFTRYKQNLIQKYDKFRGFPVNVQQAMRLHFTNDPRVI